MLASNGIDEKVKNRAIMVFSSVLFLFFVLNSMSSYKDCSFQNCGVVPSEVLEYKHQSKFNQPKVIIFTGLAQTGQHTLRKLIGRFCGKSELQCKPICSLSHRDYAYGKDAESFNVAREAALNELKSLDSDTLYVASLFGASLCKYGDSMDFPSQGAALNSLMHPDILDVVRLSKEANVDLKLVVSLTKNLPELTLRWMNRDDSPNTFRVLQTIEAQLHSLYGQLTQISTDQYRFFDGDKNRFLEDESIDEWLQMEGAKAFLDQEGPSLSQEEGEILPEMQDFLDDQQPALEILWNLKSGSNQNRRPIPLPRTQRSKIVFWAGLEGTGHHLWNSIVKTLREKEKVAPACKLNRALYAQSFTTSMWHAETLVKHSNARANANEALQEIAEMAPEVPLMVNCLGGCYQGTSGMMSYPNFGGSNKNMQRPNMISLARLASKHEIGLGVILLMRNTDSIVASTVDHRHFTDEGREIRILYSNALGLLSTLDALDRRYTVACIDFNDKSKSFMKDVIAALGGSSEDVMEAFEANVRTNSTYSSKVKTVNPKVAIRKAFTQSLRDTLAELSLRYCN